MTSDGLGGPPGWADQGLPAQHIASAELVRRHLVVLRGGVIFLSSRDGAALLKWLDDGVPVARILRGLEVASERRRQRGDRAPLQLTHAARHLAAPRAAAAPPAAVVADQDAVVALLAWVDQSAQTPLARAFPVPRTALRAGIAALAGQGHREVAAKAIGLVGDFFAACWDALGADGRARYEAAAAEAAGDLSDVFSEDEVALMVEEHARGLLRADAPGLDADGVLRVVGW